MPAAPFALNIMGGSFLYGSFRNPATGLWQSEGTLMDVSTPFSGVFSSGSIVPALAGFQNALGRGGVGAEVLFIKPGLNNYVVIGTNQYQFPYGDFGNGSVNTLSYPTGPFPYGGNLFCFIKEFLAPIPSGNSTLAAVASLDGGNTWATQDAGNSPLIHDTTKIRDAVVSNPYWDGVSRYVYFTIQSPCGNSPPFTVSILQFDMQTRTWATLHTGVNEFSSRINPRCLWNVVYADGTPGILYSLSAGSWDYRELVSGSLTTELNLNVGPPFYSVAVVIPNNISSPNRMDVFGFRRNSGPPTSRDTPTYCQVAQGGTRSADLFDFPILGAGTLGTDSFNWGVVDQNLGLIMLSIDDKDTDTSNPMWECPINGPYVFVKNSIPPPDPAIDPPPPSCAMVFYGLFSAALTLTCPP